MTKLYQGYRTSPGLLATVTVKVGDEKARVLATRTDVVNHSLCFDYGGGDWPSNKQLAVALLADAFGDDARALRLHEHFAKEYVQILDRLAPWSAPDRWVREFAERLEAQLR